MKAIILGAGEGTRLRPYTNDRPKCMVPYRGRSILAHQLEVLRGAGVDDVVVVGGYCANALADEPVRVVLNMEYNETNMVHSLFCAEHEMQGDVIVSYGDIVYRRRILDALVASPEGFAVTVDMCWRDLWERRMEDPLQDAETLKLAPDGRILELGRKPRSLEEIQGQYMGLFRIAAEVMPAVIDHYHAMDREALYDGRPFRKMFMTSFIQSIIDRGLAVHAVPVYGGWIEIDRPEDMDVDPVACEEGT